MRVLLSGGGTGGHIYPALSTAEALREHAEALLFLGGETGPEGRLVREAGWDFIGLSAAPLRRSARGLATAAAGAGSGGVKALRVLRKFRPDVVVVTGGYAGLAAGLAAGVLRIPLILEEPNAVPGRVTRVLSPMACLIATALRGPERRLPAATTVCTGYPIRMGITDGSASAARERWDLPPDRPTVLIYGGSQGARTLNLAVDAALECWTALGFNVLHSVGRKLYDESAAQEVRRRHFGYRPEPYIDGIADAYAVADLVVCRGGASSIAEATACGKPMVVVPYPYHADRHQVENGRVIEAAGAGVLMENRYAVAALPGLVVSLMGDAARRHRMADASRNMGRPDAAERIAEHVRQICADRHREARV